MSKLVLYILGEYTDEQVIEIPDYHYLDSNDRAKEENWEIRAKARIDFVNNEAGRMKINNLRAITEADGYYMIELFIND